MSTYDRLNDHAVQTSNDVADQGDLQLDAFNVEAFDEPAFEVPELRQDQRIPVQTTDAKSDPKRMEYWQSQATQFKNEYEKLAPLGELISQRPDLLDVIESHLQGQVPNVSTRQQVAVASEPQVEVEKAPVAPTKPSSYNKADLLDPDSDTYKYEEALIEYKKETLDYAIKNANRATEKLNKTMEAQTRAVEMKQKEQGVRLYIAQKFNADQKTVDAFLQELDRGNPYDIDTLYEFWQFKQSKGSTPPQTQAQQTSPTDKVKQMQARISTQQLGLSATHAPSSSAKAAMPLDDEMAFSAALINYGKGMR